MTYRRLAFSVTILVGAALLAGTATLAAERKKEEKRGFTQADFDRHLEKLKQLIPENEDFTVIVEPPFVVIGDESSAKVRERAKNLVRWTVEKLKAAYFEKDPDEILDIWLFADDDSFRKHCKSIFNSTPDTPFGYYSPTDRALIMNIGTGGGTLVHEIVHPYVAANLPNCPTWFNEGLASLYERSNEEHGEIRGYPNWRLPGLQKAIKKEQVPSFKRMCGMTAKEFYEGNRGAAYSQARYLCYYLQENGLLKKFYREFHAGQAKDPTGYQTLKRVLDVDDMAAFQKQWEQWVSKLECP